ncbi:MAG: TetR/AcrR family transcriptional regulator [Sedimentisphaerales bacterium]|nr:TetR/AcrR family transcriptional regulator [Sedimentisphaerales bacterium]
MAVFTDCGVDASTIEMITERADLGKGTFYNHFSDKGEILGALIQHAIDQLLEGIGKYSSLSANLEQALEGLVKAHTRFFLDHREGYVLLFQGRVLLKLDREVGEIEEPYLRYLREMENLLQPFVPSVEPVKVRRLACAMAGSVSGFLSFAMITMEAAEIEKNMEPMRKAFVESMIAFMGRS